MNIQKLLLLGLISLALFGCEEIEPKPFEPSPGHITPEQKPAGKIPELVKEEPVLPKPQPPVEQEKYTVVVNEVPAKELLFALARDAKINVDIDPRINGVVTINAVDQTLPQILERISRQIDMRYEFKNDNLVVQPDEPYLRTYKIGYINMARDTTSNVTIATQISTTGGGFEEGGGTSGGGGGGNNNSTTNVTNTSLNRFWENLVRNVEAILEQSTSNAGGRPGTVPVTTSVIPSPETGILTVRATSSQHKKIQEFLDQALESANRQVMIQATIVEVDLNEEYKAGIDWSFLNNVGGLSLTSATLVGAPVPATVLSLFELTYDKDIRNGRDTLNLTINLLNEFGNTKVLSSPQLMALNNQTAILKVVNNEVFFTIDVQTDTTQGVSTTNSETTIHTVPVGIVMAITPQINDNGTVILNVRPTISRVGDQIQDPNPALRFSPTGVALADPIPNLIPEIQVREMESLLRLNNGQIAVLGGLMQDSGDNTDSSIPGASKAPILGKAFQSKSKVLTKTELVIFLRPIIVNNPDIDGGDLQLYKSFLERRPGEEGSTGASKP